MLIENYMQQYNRVLRYVDQLKNQNRSQQEYIDDMWTFFQHCHHLKDWLKNDDTLPLAFTSVVENEVDTSKTLRVIADLANRSKHLKLTRNIREDANVTGIGVTIYPGMSHINLNTMETTSNPGRVEYHIKVETSSGDVFDALQLALDAVLEWERICKKHGITVPTP